jgi:hypothetical protein
MTNEIKFYSSIKLIILFTAVTSMTASCSTMRRLTNGNTTEMVNKSNLAREESIREARLAEETENKNRAERKRVQKVGTSFDKFCEVFGEPNSTEYENGLLVGHFQVDDNFYIYKFKNNKLIGWSIDSEKVAEANKIEEENRQIEAENASRAEEFKNQSILLEQQARAKAFQNMQNDAAESYRQSELLRHQKIQEARQPAQRPRVYQAAPVRQTDFGCMDDCSNMGRAYQFCQAKCSY